MPLRLIAAGKTDIGLQREQNEDSLYVELMDESHPASGIFIVSDGMGGYHAGEIASKIAVETISEDLKAVFDPASSQTTIKLSNRRGRKRGKNGKNDSAKTQPAESVATEASGEAASVEVEGDENVDPTQDDAGATRKLIESVVLEHYADKLREAVERSSAAIVAYGAGHREARGLGATVTAALVIEGQALVANVGDSRTCLWRDGKLERITRDHSLVSRLVEAGQIQPDDVYDHPSRNLIYRSLGAGNADVDVDIFTEALRPGDMLLLCSDGLWEMVRDPEISEILSSDDDVEAQCVRLVTVANENGGEDNITAVLVRCVED